MLHDLEMSIEEIPDTEETTPERGDGGGGIGAECIPATEGALVLAPKTISAGETTTCIITMKNVKGSRNSMVMRYEPEFFLVNPPPFITVFDSTKKGVATLRANTTNITKTETVRISAQCPDRPGIVVSATLNILPTVQP